MIRKFVLVNENMADFCCVLNFMGMEVPNSVSNVVWPVIFMTSNTKSCKFYDKRVQEKDKRVRQKNFLRF